ncbi:hypothetical protein AAZX31_01G117400 [Glycine max]
MIQICHHEQVRATMRFKEVSVPLIFHFNFILFEYFMLCYTSWSFLFWGFGKYMHKKFQSTCTRNFRVGYCLGYSRDSNLSP